MVCSPAQKNTQSVQIWWLITVFVIIYGCSHCLSLFHSLMHCPPIWFCTVFYLSSSKLQHDLKPGLWSHLSPLLCSFLTSFPSPSLPHPCLISWFHLSPFSPLVASWTVFVCMFVCFWLLLGAVGGLRTEQNLNFNPSPSFFVRAYLCLPPRRRPS